MNKRIEKMIPIAYTAVKQELLNDKGGINKQYNGYISSFGASVIQSGMLLALIFNHQKDANTEMDRNKLMKVIYRVVRPDDPAEGSNLLIYYQSMEGDKRNQKQLKQSILDAATAIKLVIRTFHLTNDGDE